MGKTDEKKGSEKIYGLSKSQYLKGRQCLKRVWLYNYRRELMEEPSVFLQSLFQDGTEVGVLARDYFPGGELIDEGYKDPQGALKHTRSGVERGVEILYEAAFLFEDILIRVDIMRKNQDGSWELIEVKSSSSDKKVHYLDCAIQKYVLQELGFPINRTYLMHLNSDYVRRGSIDLHGLFVLEPMDNKIFDAMGEVPQYLPIIRDALSRPDEPKGRIGSICKNPYECDFKAYCWSDVPKDSIHYISRIHKNKRTELMDMGVEQIKDIPDGYKLSDLQEIQVHCEKNHSQHVDKENIKKHFAKLEYPYYFLDFETCQYAIPPYDGVYPHEKLPFQYSLHIKKSPEDELEHHEFLFYKNADPKVDHARHLVERIGSEGSVIVFHATFERGRLQDMAKASPELSSQIESIIERLWDLELPFAKKYFYDPGFYGSSSIKKVLPVLVPEMDYDLLEIGDGAEAFVQYKVMLSLNTDDIRREKIKRNLFEYCKQDTLAMVKLLNYLEGASR